jgi:hypothetical protein
VKYLFAALVLILAAGCGGGGTHGYKTAGPTSTLPECPLAKTFNDGELKFGYPTCWTAATYSETSSFSNSIVDLGTQATHEPCHRITNGTSCGWPVVELTPGHVLLRWAENGFAGWTLNRAPGATATVAGRPAREAIARPGVCGYIGADETISVAISRPGIADNWFSMTACLRSPGNARAADQVQQMLATVTFSGP